MSQRSFHLHDGHTGAAITVRVMPRSSRNEISEILDDGTVKIRLTAPPAADKTNQALIVFLAEVLNARPEQIEIVAGELGNNKLITIMDMNKDAVQERILQHIA